MTLPAPTAPAEPKPPPDLPDAARPGTHLAYNPALDGIRGLALTSVLLYHGYGGDLFKGSFLAVSTFFTLSGFLITSLLLTEQKRAGGIALGGFYARRLRRLLPASALTLVLVSLSAVLTNEGWERTLGGDVTAAGLHIANWRFIVEDRAYAQLFNADPPLVLHFWSLAIEEQFYWVFPLVTAGALYLFRGSLKAFTGVLAALLAGSLLLTVLFRNDPTFVYYATPIRGGEILMGGLLAVLVARGWFLGNKRWVPVIAGLGAVCLVAQLVLWWIAEQDHPSLKYGGLLAYSVISAALVLSANVEGPVRRLMSFEPLRLLGVVSYGVYLFHWPLFLLMSPERVDGWFGAIGIDFHPRTWKLMIIRLVVVLLLAAASYRWFESPIRRGKRPQRVRPQLLAVGGVVGVLAVAVVVPKVSEPPIDQFAAYIEATAGPDPADLQDGARIGVAVGDSTASTTAWGIGVWQRENGYPMVLLGGSADAGCSIGDEGSVVYRGLDEPLRAECGLWRQRLQEAIDTHMDRYGRVDFAMVQSGPWDVADRRVPGSGDELVHIGEPVYDEYLRSEMTEVVDFLVDQGITVVWLTSPVTDWTMIEPPLDSMPAEFAPERMQLYNDMINEMAEQREGMVVVDLAAWAASLPPEELERLRSDGVHWGVAERAEVAEWLGPQILAVADDEPVEPVG